MERVKINFENCYGIRSLKDEFDFTKHKLYVVYAPNGVMKSSFARTFKDYSDNVESKDRVYPTRLNWRSIEDETGKPLRAEAIFVVEPYDDAFKSNKISTLLANRALKERYDAVYSDIESKKQDLLKELKKTSGVKKDLDIEIAEAITHDSKAFFVALDRVKNEVLANAYPHLASVDYSAIFNDKTKKLIEDESFRKSIAEYIAVYDVSVPPTPCSCAGNL